MSLESEYKKILRFTQSFGWKQEDVEDFTQWLFLRSLRLHEPFKAVNLHFRLLDYRRSLEGTPGRKTTELKKSELRPVTLDVHHAISSFEDSEIYRLSRLEEKVKYMKSVDRIKTILNELWGMTDKEISFILGF